MAQSRPFSKDSSQNNLSADTPLIKSGTYRVDRMDSNAIVIKNAIQISSKYKSDNKKLFVQLSSVSNVHSAIYPTDFIDGLDEGVVQLSMPVRKAFNFSLGPTQNVKLITLPNTPINNAASLTLEIQQCFPNSNIQRTLSLSEMVSCLRAHCSAYQFSPGQILIIPYLDGIKIQLKVSSVDGYQALILQQRLAAIANIDNKTNIVITVSTHTDSIKLHQDTKPRVLSLDFAAQGVGGHKKELAQMLREGFYSRVMPMAYSKAYGVKHTKGILLYGPPGTGKTLIARVIGGMFTKDKVKVINGAELKNRYVGQSTENLRNVFSDAIHDWKTNGDKSELHVIIFDEIDALCPARGSRHGGSGVDEDMVAQLLTLLDGVDSPQNVLVIGMTNRKDLIDAALLRPGRLEAHIEIGLPGQDDRLEILKIKTAAMSKAELLANDVVLSEWARKTVNYTGAELEQLVKKAVYFAMGNNFDDAGIDALVMKSDIKSCDQLAKVGSEHLERAFLDITPAFGIDAALTRFNQDNFVIYNQAISCLIDHYHRDLKAFHDESDVHVLSYLISGEAGTGKTQLAIKMAYAAGARFVKIISPDKLLSLPLAQQFSYIDDVFANLKRVERGVLILDGLEDLLGADTDLHHYSNPLRLKYEACIRHLSESDNKCIVIATTKKHRFIDNIGFNDLFNEAMSLDKVNITKDNAIDIFSKLCLPLGIEVDGELSGKSMSMTIRDLMYHINKFCAVNETRQLNLTSFAKSLDVKYLLAQSPDSSSSSAGLFASQKR